MLAIKVILKGDVLKEMYNRLCLETVIKVKSNLYRSSGIAIYLSDISLRKFSIRKIFRQLCFVIVKRKTGLKSLFITELL